MGPVYANISLGNPLLDGTQGVEVLAAVIPEANYLCLPRSVVAELGLGAVDMRTVTTEDAGRQRCRYVGPVLVRFGDRACFTGALELGSEITLGSIPMLDMGLAVEQQRLVAADHLVRI